MLDELTKLVNDAFEKGRMASYEPLNPFKAFGFESNPFIHTTFDEIRKTTCFTPRIHKIASLIGQLLSKKNQSSPLDGVIVSVTHSGTSILVEKTIQILQDTNEKVKSVVLLDAKNLVCYEKNRYMIAKTLNQFRREIALKESINDTSLLIIDNADYLLDFFISFREAIAFDFPEIPILFVFTSSAWSRLKSLTLFYDYDLFNKTLPATFLPHLSEDDIVQFLEVKLSKNGLIQKPFTIENIKIIARITNGSLQNSAFLCKKICEECYYNGLDIASTSMVLDIANLLDLTVSEKLEELTKEEDSTKLFILALIAMKSIAQDVGITYDELIMNIDVQKTTISYHLSQLLKMKIITKRTLNRKAFYKLNENLQILADQTLLSKFEAKEKYIKLESNSDLLSNRKK